jgi:hypothetical protein
LLVFVMEAAELVQWLLKICVNCFMKKVFVFLFLLVTSNLSIAQDKIALYEDSLKTLGATFMSDSIEDNRIQANYKFIRMFVNSLKEKNSYNHPFKQLQEFIAIRKSDDNKFRIFTWFTQLDNGDYRYYGAVQVNNPNKLELYPLVDNSQNLNLATNLSDTTLATNQWFGALYYQIVPILGIKDPYYILLGWKGKNLQSNSKVVETLFFKDGKPFFGRQAFEQTPKSNDFKSRIVFTYTKNANMMLRYLKDEKVFVFDHLVPQSKALEGMLDLYAPDLSYDTYKYKFGKWIIQENVKFTNLPEASDELFIDPAEDSRNTSAVIKN